MAFQFKLGQEVRDVVSGTKGIIMARTEFLTGCTQYCVHTPKKHLANEGIYIDEGRLVYVGKGVKLPDTGAPAGADMSNPPFKRN